MYSRVQKPILTIYDIDTGELIGEALFDLTQETERTILNLVNYNTVPQTLELSNYYIYPASPKYVPPVLYKPTRYKGVLRALFTDSVSGAESPFEIHFDYDIRFFNNLGFPYHFQSVTLDNIKVDAAQKYY